MREAYATLLSSDSYLAPVLVLHLSVARTGCTRPLIVLTTPNLSSATMEALRVVGVITRPIETIANPAAGEYVKNVWRRLKGTYGKIGLYATVYTKLRIWQLTDFSKIVFLDCDMMLTANCDELFAWPAWSAVNAGGGIQEYRHWQGMNSGLMVIEPSAELFTDMMQHIDRIKSADWGDQGFLQVYFPRWPELNELHLPHIYNMPIEFIDQYAIELGYHLPANGEKDDRTVKIIHYWRAYRPWQVPLLKMDRSLRMARPLYFEAFWLWIRAYDEVCASFAGATQI